MNRIEIKHKNKYKIIACIFFLIFLCIGITIFKDYGISYDERATRGIGGMALRYVVLGDKSLFTYSQRDYGPAFEMLLGVIEVILNLSDNPRAIFLMRHLVTFLLFYTAVFFFYRLAKFIFKSWRIGLLGSLFLILSPRIFADSFYNSKDIPCLSLFIISIYTLIMYLDRKTLAKGFLHALTCAILIDIRIVGVIVPLLTIIFLIADILIIKPTKEDIKKNIIPGLLLYAFYVCLFTILFWPTLWRNPVYNFVDAFKNMSRFNRWDGTVLYFGNYIQAISLPWHYIPVWIGITTPVSYIIYFFIGLVISIKLFLTNPKTFYFTKKYDLIFLLWFFLPLVSIIVFRSVLYDAWRQLFFIYPAFLMITLRGLIYLFRFIKLKLQVLHYRVIVICLAFLVALNLLNVIKFMVQYHPFQNLYFNILSGKNWQDIKNNFELDYWGLSYRKALEYILKNDTDKTIKIYVTDYPGKVNAYILNAKDRARLVYVADPSEAKYFLGNYRGHKEEYPYKEEFYSIKINGIKIMVAYRLS